MSMFSGHRRVCLLPRLTISDIIAVNGMVRTVCAGSTDVILVAKRAHAGPIRNLYADVPNLRFKFVDSWEALHSPKDEGLLDQVRRLKYHILPLPSFRETCPYALTGLDPALERTAFRMRRNPEAEAALLRKVHAAVGTTYVVVHDDTKRRIRRVLLPDYPVVDVRDPVFRTDNVFDWLGVLDQAIQVHAVDSCFLLVADFLSLRARKFLHAYADTCNTASSRHADVVKIYEPAP